jgi:hypothetical protein
MTNPPGADSIFYIFIHKRFRPGFHINYDDIYESKS